MKYNPAKHDRQSIRLPGYDYSRPGAYFITMCVKNREWLFGKIKNGVMNKNNAGIMVEKWHLELPNKFSNIINDEFCIMPNHFHSIIIITSPSSIIVRADPCVCPIRLGEQPIQLGKQGEHTGSPPQFPLQNTQQNKTNIPSIVQWFKTMTTNEYIRNVKTNCWQPFDGKLWQRNYFEHINRCESELFRIRQYIRNNPLNWKPDKDLPFH